MNDNSIMRAAQRNKKDEFYTQRDDILKELLHYKEQFRGKKIFLPCDSAQSEFTQFFKDRAYRLQFQEVRTLCLAPEYRDFSEMWRITPDGYTLCYHHQNDNGDFRTSVVFRTLLEWADIIVTNPPFSLFREFMTMILESGKQFCIIGNMNQILTKDLLPYVTTERLWFGPSIHSGDRVFRVPDDYPLNTAGSFVKDGERFIRVKGVRWFTNMRPDSPDVHPHLPIVPTVLYKDMQYERFDYMPDIICVNRTQDIPCDYDGLMGVQLTYFDHHNPDLFEIVDGVNRYLVLDSLNINDKAKKNKWHLLTVNDKVKYFRFLIRRKQDIK